MGLIKAELKRIDGSKDKSIFTRLISEKFTGFVVAIYHSNGEVLFEREWKNGRAYGYQVEYYDNGQIKYYHQMDDFNEIGPSMAYWEDGSIRHEETDEYTRQYDREGNITFDFKEGIGVIKGEEEDYTI